MKTLILSMVLFLGVAVSAQDARLKVGDVSLRGSVTPSTVPAGGNVTFNFTITNHGKKVAPSVVLVQDLINRELVSAVPSSGYCHIGDGKPLPIPLPAIIGPYTVYCEVGNLSPSASASITIVQRTLIFGDGIHTTPVRIDTDALASAEQSDSNPDNNQIQLSFDSIPSPNRPPQVSITNLDYGAVFVTSVKEPLIIPLRIKASDVDGKISTVKVLDSGFGAGGDAVSVGNGNYTFDYSTTETGYHNLSAVAIDNEGRPSLSSAIQILINNPHTLTITKPDRQLVEPGAELVIDARSGTPANQLQKIEVYDRGSKIGEMKAVSNSGGVHTYRLTLPKLSRGRHGLSAILTDLSGATTISPSVDFKATILPTISITAPISGSDFSAHSSVYITVETGDMDGYVKELNFFANGKLIGTKSESIVKGTSTFKWISPDPGAYSITATATDDTDETVTSNVVIIGAGRRLN